MAAEGSLSGPSSLHPNFLARLKVLTIDDDTTLRTPRDQAPSLYRHLSLYPSRSKLFLQFWTEDNEGVHPPFDSIPIRLPSITDLDLTLRAQVSVDSTKRLVSVFNRLSTLSIQSTTEMLPGEFVSLLDCVEPDNLTTLNLYSDELDNEESMTSPLLEQTLGRFRHLRHLSLDGVSIGVEFLNLLDPQLPLETLVLCPCAWVSLESLLKILRGPTKLRHLKLLHLSLHEDLDDPPISLRMVDGEVFLDENGEFKIDEMWEMRLWPSEIRRCELKELIKVANEEGVVLEGNVAELSEEYEDEVEFCEWLKSGSMM